MKARKIIYFILGIFLVTVNLLINILDFRRLYMQSDDVPYIIGSIIGGNIFLLIGLLLLRASYKLSKKIKLQQVGNSLEGDIDLIGKF